MADTIDFREGGEQALAEYRAAHVPLYSAQPLKFGVFSTNSNNSVFISETPTSFEVSWAHSKAIAQQCDRMGFEMIVPVARWRGFGGRMNFAGENFETLTYAAGIAACTNYTMPFATVHVPIFNPVAAAKAITTIDHISGGRAGLNIVMGWNEKEMEMMGVELRPHTDRYNYGAEWLKIVEGLWRESEPFDFEGEYFNVLRCEAEPKPVQPRPVLINAGGSPAGVEYSAHYADFNYTSFTTVEQAAGYCSNVRDIAFSKYQRAIGMLTLVVVVCRDTEAEAKAAYQSILDHGDWTAADNLAQGMNVQTFGEHLKPEFLARFVAGTGGYALIGTPEQVVDGLQGVKDAGIDGVFLALVDYVEELKYFEERVMPLLKQKGLRI